ncbi:N-6 DNA methylase [Sphingomonas sp. CFBP 13728]|uniref:Eco57I restriction-modification methylase domain-containing protein n=1 Tax=Sphingomonas sp. CFBP 13728 TaxID=2775294 RepID=UPI00177FF8CC|nr:N-6 DNA methylase [Sphingomonas sp. CFBP 13728]MBD8621191.1 N-6 DNA methylase [Sphingomonas sp. CFBP 13728]
MTDLFTKLKKDSHNWANEEEVRKGWLKHIENALGMTFHAERGRNDASYNQVIIEFKDRGLFKGSIKSASFKEAIYDRLFKYIKARSKLEGIPEEDYIGIAIDGVHICFAFMKGGKIVHRNLLPFNQASVELVAQACRDSKRRAVTAENLVEDFGHQAEIGHAMMSNLVGLLEKKLTSPGNNKVKLLFEEWRTLFGQVADLSKAQAAEIRKHVPFSPKIASNDMVSAALFAIHSYNAIVMKLLAAEIIAQFDLTAYPDFCEHLLSHDDDKLLELLDVEVERGAFFEAARIKGFVEEAIFSWYTDAAPPGKDRAALCAAIRPLLTQLSLYRMDDLSAARSRDVLKSFYQALVPEVLRKALGEFYTPDWLVDVACDRAQVQDWSKVRALDPTCGSGSFLLEVIRRKRALARAAKWSDAKTLTAILHEVWGFDLNPLAVQSARVNFLIAIADLVASTGAEVELPVLLADAVYSPAQSPVKGQDFVEYGIGSAQADLNIVLPAALAFDRIRLDAAFVIMAEAVHDEKEYPDVEKLLIASALMTKAEGKAWRDALSTTYEQVLELHRKAWNGIWFRIVRNFFWSAVAGQFDVVVGNPPWVRWSNLPERYRDRIKPTCERYTIFSETPYHGGNELDISGMITYTVGDKWLKQGGALVFVITQTHFQSPSSQGFRSFRIDSKANLIPESVDDLKLLKPFPKVANKTAIVRLRKVGNKQTTKYPVPYTVWEKAIGQGGSLPENLTKAAVLARVSQKAWEATPVSGGNSPWAILPPGRFKDMEKLQGQSNWAAGRKGITADLNGVYMVRIIAVNSVNGLVQVETRPEAGKTDIGPARKFWIEPDLLFPLLKGAADFSACHVHVKNELFVVVPNKGILKADYAAAEAVMAKLPQTKKYLNHFRALLERRSTYRLRQPKAPYYSVYNSGSYTFCPHKVVWAELSTSFEAAVFTESDVPLIGSRPYVPDHKVYFAEFQNEAEAHFVCGTLNSTLVKEYVESHTIQIQVSNIFKHLSIPRFDPKDSDHVALSKASLKAHAAKTADARAKQLLALDKLAEIVLTA